MREPGEQVGIEQRRRHVVLHVVPELLDQARRVDRRRRTALVDVSVVERPHAQPDPQPAGIGADLGGERARQRRRRPRAAVPDAVITSSSAAESRTLRVSTPSVFMPTA